MVRTSNLRFIFFRTVIQIKWWALMSMRLGALPLYVQLTPCIKPLDSDNETTLNVSLEGEETHSLIVTPIPAGHCPVSLMFFLASKEKTLFFFLAISDGKLVIRSESIIFLTIYKKFDNIDDILIIFTTTQRFAKQIPISYLVGRAVFQSSFKPSPHGSVPFKMMWSIFVTNSLRL